MFWHWRLTCRSFYSNYPVLVSICRFFFLYILENCELSMALSRAVLLVYRLKSTQNRICYSFRIFMTWSNPELLIFLGLAPESWCSWMEKRTLVTRWKDRQQKLGTSPYLDACLPASHLPLGLLGGLMFGVHPLVVMLVHACTVSTAPMTDCGGHMPTKVHSLSCF